MFVQCSVFLLLLIFFLRHLRRHFIVWRIVVAWRNFLFRPQVNSKIQMLAPWNWLGRRKLYGSSTPVGGAAWGNILSRYSSFPNIRFRMKLHFNILNQHFYNDLCLFFQIFSSFSPFLSAKQTCRSWCCPLVG